MTTTIDPGVVTAPPPYRRFTWQEALVDYLPPRRQTQRAFVWVERLPTIVILLLTSLLALRLRNSAFIDEALYINAGQDYLNHVLYGAVAPHHGDYFSGVPVLYPVLAAALDAVGGLYAVRLFSLVCVLLTVVVVQDLTMALFRSRRAGLLAGAVFALTGSVLFVAFFGTFDALCILLLAVSAWLGVKRSGTSSAVGVGLVLALALSVKYACAVFVPVVLALLVFAGPQAIRRAATAVLTLSLVLASILSFYGATLWPGISFTTATRAALSPVGRSQLLVYVGLNIGLLLVLALIGAFKAARDVRSALTVGVLLAGAALLPIAQIRLGEAVSFDKHTAYAALFLAPLAGFGLSTMSRGLLKLAPITLVLLVAVVAGLSRSGTLYSGWVPLDPVLAALGKDPAPGLYISSSTDSLKYYTRKTSPDVRWQTTFALYAEGTDQIRQAVNANRYQTVILRSASTGSAEQDRAQRIFEQALRDNPRYELLREPFPVQPFSTDRWFVYHRKPVVPSQLYPGDPARGARPATGPASVH